MKPSSKNSLTVVEKKPRILGTSEIHLGLVVARDLKKGVGSRPTLVRRTYCIYSLCRISSVVQNL